MRALTLFSLFVLSAGLCSSAFGHAFSERIPIPEPIREQIDHLRKDGRFADRVAAFDQLISDLSHLGFETRDAALARTDLDRKTIELILQHSRGIFSVGEILKRPFVAGGYSLGLSAVAGIYPMFSERLNLSPWMTAYPDLGVDWRKNRNHTPVFLAKVEATQRPVVFFLPNKLLTWTSGSITVDEFEWYLEEPSRMKNVFFVVGSYDAISQKTHGLAEKAGISEDAFRALFMRAIGATSSQYDQAL